MSNKDPILITLLFNECINNRDIQGLSQLMTEDHTFIDSSDEIHEGKEPMIAGWTNFFSQYPDYLNHFSVVESRGDLVLIIGHSTCSYDPLDGPAIWRAKIENERVAEWRVYLDTTENRDRLKLKS